MKPADVKQILEDTILEVVSKPALYVYDPQKDFSRTRKLSFYTVIKMLIGMGGSSLEKEMLESFSYIQNDEITKGYNLMHLDALYTNLPRDKFPVDTLKELYHLRWGIETAFRELKYNVGLASVHSKKPSTSGNLCKTYNV